jgi:hydroxyacylglutathione hydrolase
MIFKQFYEPSLGHASYLIGSDSTGEALVLDVRRDVGTYYDYAREHGMQIRYAADTHQHNDYLTGICELESRGELELLSSARAELGYRSRGLDDGDVLQMGEVTFEVMHTPGHTPEHISLLVRDRSRGEDPVLLLSGGALLVDDVARPDLLGSREQTEQGAKSLAATLKDRILPLPDHVMVFPTHVAGSLCGGNIGSMLFTTIGYERRLNRILQCVSDQQTFTRECLNLDALPIVPPYWPRMRKANVAGPEPLGVLTEPPALGVEAFVARAEQGAIVVDCRSPEAFAGGHVPGAQNIGYGDPFPTWAGSVLPPDQPLLLVVDTPDQVWPVVWHLLRIGFDVPVGFLAGGMMAWRTSGRELEFLPAWSVRDLDRERRGKGRPFILDVRQPSEWQGGHVPGAQHIPGGELPRRLDEVPKRPVAVYCGSGYRSSVAASLLRRRGHRDVVNVMGGFAAWKQAGLEVAEPKVA